MRPKALIDTLGLLAPIYRPTAAYGHFGRSEFAWEKTDRAAKIADDLLRGASKGVAKTNGANGHGKKPAARKPGKRPVAAEA
jgi:S-adenosylmethionine synthetase